MGLAISFVACIIFFVSIQSFDRFFTKQNGQEITSKNLDAHMKLLNPFLKSPNPPLSTSNKKKIYNNYRLQTQRGEMLVFTPKNARGILKTITCVSI